MNTQLKMTIQIQVSIKEEGLSLAFSLIVDIPYHHFLSCVGLLLFSPFLSVKSLLLLSYLFSNLSQ